LPDLRSLKFYTIVKTGLELATGILTPKERLEKVIEDYTVKPHMLGLEVINICNARCIFCGYPKLKRAKGVMPMEVMKKALHDYCDIGGGNLGLFPVVGETLLDPLLLERIRMARRLREIKRISFFTNGLLLDRVGIRDILTSGVNLIAVSTPGFDEVSYKRVYRIRDYKKVFNNVYKLVRLNHELGHKVRIAICVRPFRSIREVQQSDDFKRIAELADEFDYQSHYDHWGGRVSQDDLLPGMKIRRLKIKREPCRVLYWNPHVLINGDVTPCGCRDMDGDMVIGNIMDKSLYNLWHSDKLRDIREGFYHGRFPRICRNCREYRSFKSWFYLSRTKEVAEENVKEFQESRFYKRIKHHQAEPINV
jgi:MoaA/NifB/PqqE/SkfB family radical SAM enzyme